MKQAIDTACLLWLAATRKNNRPAWSCVCDCTIDVEGTRLRKGTATSCGCATANKHMVGRKFGRLTVISRAENNKGKSMWLCDCGIETIVRGDSLLKAAGA